MLQDWCRWPDEPFEEMDSTLAVQQYIQQLIKKDPSNIEAILTMPESQDEGVWKYEHLRSEEKSAYVVSFVSSEYCLNAENILVKFIGNFVWS